MIKKILIGIDDSKYAENAAKYGFELAESLNAHVGLVHIVEPMAIPMNDNGANTILGTPMLSLNGINDMEMINAQSAVSENIIERTAKKFGGSLQVTHFNEYGSTADGIISCAIEFKADLVVLGTHHRSGLDRLLMGNIAEDVLRHSHVPVLVVPFVE
jgi:nucleotide-binding universal stress UspA family protein